MIPKETHVSKEGYRQGEHRTPGSEVSGFILQSVDVLDDYHGYGYHYQHRITGMEVYHISNDDPENFFSFVFRTPVQDDCGTPHIIEHSVLAGSDSYPVRDPFMSLLKGSAQTFMNAMTYPDFTAYPAASVVKQDFMNLFKVYADAVFNPLLKKETFWQEGIRITHGEEGKLRFEGVVFNEMLGELSDHDSIVSRGSVRHLFPDTPYSYESGGDPLSIVSLTYEKFKAFHSTYYHPSNARLFFYGDEDIDSYLQHLDSQYLCEYAPQKPIGKTSHAQTWKKERQITIPAPLMDINDEKRTASITFNWATSSVDDPVEVITLSLLTDILLGNPGAPLYSAIIESSLAKDISQVSGMETSFNVMPFTVGLRGIDPDDAMKAKELVFNTLETLVREGIDPTLVENAIKRQEFSLQEITGSVPMGLRAMNRCLRGWLNDSLPSVSLQIGQALQKVRQKVAELQVGKDELFSARETETGKGYFEQWIIDNLLNNTHLLTLIVNGEASFSDDIDRQLEKQLDPYRSDENLLQRIQKETMQFSLYEQIPDRPEDLAKIPTLTREDVDQPIRTLSQEQVIENGVPLLLQSMHTNGIIYIDGMFDVRSLDTEELMILPLLTRMLHMCGIHDTPYTEVAKRVRSHTGGFQFFIETGSLLDDVSGGVASLAFRVKCLSRELRESFSLLCDLFTGAAVDDVKRLSAVLNDVKSDFEANVSASAHLFASQRATSHFSPLLDLNEKMNGIAQWDFLRTLDAADQTVMDQLAGRLKKLLKKIAVRRNLILHLLSDEQELERCRALAGECIASLEEGSTAKAVQQSTLDVSDSPLHCLELFSLPSSVAFDALATRAARATEDRQAHQSLLAHIMTTGVLWDSVRGSGGAYGVSAHVDMMEALFTFQTYRDPRISGSFNDLFSALRQIAETGVPQEALDSSLISIISRELHPIYPQKGAIMAFRRYLYHISDDFRQRRRELLIAATVEDIRQAAVDVLKALEDGECRVVIANANQIRREQEGGKLENAAIIPLGL